MSKQQKLVLGWLRWCQGKQKDSILVLDLEEINKRKLTRNPIDNTLIEEELIHITCFALSLSKNVSLEVDILISMRRFEKE